MLGPCRRGPCSSHFRLTQFCSWKSRVCSRQQTFAISFHCHVLGLAQINLWKHRHRS
jgi:hypothetical protein